MVDQYMWAEENGTCSSDEHTEASHVVWPHNWRKQREMQTLAREAPTTQRYVLVTAHVC
jgi:hypothetical protein